ncbi:MAG: hypothetical protein ACRYFS_11225 [Janthinobacterium lividum]
MNKQWALSLTLWTVVTSAAAAASQPSYTVTDLGTLPGGHYSRATALNNNGQVVGWADTGATQNPLTAHAFLWERGRMRDIDTFPNRQQAPGTVACAINDQGEVVGGVEPVFQGQGILTGSYLFQNVGWLWRKGQMQTIGRDAVAINDKGQVVIKNNQQSLIWQNGKTEAVPPLPGFQSITVTCLNSDGDVAGYGANGPGDNKGFVRLGGKVSLLGTLRGDNTSRAVAMNDRGQVIGMSLNDFYEKKGNSTTSGTRSLRAFFWQDGKLTDLGNRIVSGIGNQGEVLGTYYQPTAAGTGTTIAFLWQGGKFTDLNALIDSSSGWKLEEARAINDHGQIVGYGEHNGQEHGFLLTPE